MSSKCTIAVCGCGTAGYWITRSLVHPPVTAGRMRMVFCDRAVIRNCNAVTCPEFTTVGQPKCDRLAELARRWSRAGIDTVAVHGCVEQLEWDRLLGRKATPGHKAFAIVGLDNWTSRLAVAEDIRKCSAASSGASIAMVQIGLDRGQASIAVFGSDLDSPCPACGLPALPDPEPCVVLTPDRALLRGNLHSEAQAAAGLVRRIIDDLMTPNHGDRWVNTKTNLVLDGQRLDTFTRPCRMAQGCLGPHQPVASMRWNTLLDPVLANPVP